MWAAQKMDWSQTFPTFYLHSWVISANQILKSTISRLLRQNQTKQLEDKSLYRVKNVLLLERNPTYWIGLQGIIQKKKDQINKSQVELHS